MLKKTPDRHPPIGRSRSVFIASVRSTIERYRMFSPGDHVVVGVSGGADSVALLYALYELQQELQIHLTVAHLNHGLRGDAARREAACVEEHARAVRLPCVCELRDVRAEKSTSGACLQEAARAARYRFFDDVRRSCNAHKLALGHSMDDQAETVLIRLLRGASTRGLGGIPPVRSGGIVRPLINLRRAAIERFLHERGITFVPDTSVHEPQYLRNRIRHELLPLLSRQYNPRIVETLCITAGLARDDEALLQEEAARVLNGCLQHETNMVRIPVCMLERHPLLAGRIIRHMLEILQGSCRGLTSAHVDAIMALTGRTGSSKRLPVPGGLVARREYAHLVIETPRPPAAPFVVQVDVLPADIRLPQAGVRILISRLPRDDTTAPQSPSAGDTIYLSADSMTLPLVIRSWTPGDRMLAFGSGAEKKIKAVFAEKKIPVRQRGCIPLLESGGRIMSVGALCVSECCRITPACRDVIAVTVTGPDPD